MAWVAAARPGTATCVLSPVRSKFDLRSIREHIRAVRHTRPDILHVNLDNPFTAPYGLLAGVLTHTVTVAVVHSASPAWVRRQQWLVRRVAPRVDAYVGVSGAVARSTESLLGLPTGSARVIYNGAELPASLAPRDAAPEPLVGAVGRLAAGEGLPRSPPSVAHTSPMPSGLRGRRWGPRQPRGTGCRAGAHRASHLRGLGRAALDGPLGRGRAGGPVVHRRLPPGDRGGDAGRDPRGGLERGGDSRDGGRRRRPASWSPPAMPRPWPPHSTGSSATRSCTPPSRLGRDVWPSRTTPPRPWRHSSRRSIASSVADVVTSLGAPTPTTEARRPRPDYKALSSGSCGGWTCVRHRAGRGRVTKASARSRSPLVAPIVK